MIDLRDGETFTEYAARREREWLDTMRSPQATNDDRARALADAIDASIMERAATVSWRASRPE